VIPSTDTTRVEAPPPEDIDGGVAVAVVGDATGGGGVVRPDNPDVTPPIDAAVPIVTTRTLTVRVQPAKDSQVQFSTEPSTWATVTPEDGTVERAVPIDADVRVVVRNKCCQETDKVSKPPGINLDFSLQALPASVVPVCDVAGTVVQVNDKHGTLNAESKHFFPKNSTQFSQEFTVVFGGNDMVSTAPITVRVDAGDTKKVPCAAK
jgi:hypothetical protein